MAKIREYYSSFFGDDLIFITNIYIYIYIYINLINFTILKGKLFYLLFLINFYNIININIKLNFL
ncbi:MAG: hypothetical protein MCS20_01805, partial [Candidatus Phytoplasma mali]|nr:hypothetical protein [Candidatus Phytoplasma mali]